MGKPDPRVTKRRVTSTNYGVNPGPDGTPIAVIAAQSVDYVRPDFLDAYVAYQERVDERGNRVWQSVVVSDEPDAGPGGYDGQTHVPAELNHPLAGTTFPATPKGRD